MHSRLNAVAPYLETTFAFEQRLVQTILMDDWTDVALGGFEIPDICSASSSRFVKWKRACQSGIVWTTHLPKAQWASAAAACE
jgi:hypothetical protein